MRSNCFGHILIILMAIQSIIGVVDAHQYHQSGLEHIEFDQNHDHIEHYGHSSMSLNVNLDHELEFTNHFQEHNDQDCHHCCHCHTYTGSALLPRFSLDLVPLASINFHYSERSVPIVLTTFLRPPIA